MMQKRLRIASSLLNPSTGVLIVTIDENEAAHLRLLLDELFPQAYIQMMTIVTNPKGSTRGRFSRVEEYAIYCCNFIFLHHRLRNQFRIHLENFL